MPRYRIEFQVVTGSEWTDRLIDITAEGVDSFDALVNAIREVRPTIGALETLHSVHVGRPMEG